MPITIFIVSLASPSHAEPHAEVNLRSEFISGTDLNLVLVVIVLERSPQHCVPTNTLGSDDNADTSPFHHASYYRVATCHMDPPARPRTFSRGGPKILGDARRMRVLSVGKFNACITRRLRHAQTRASRCELCRMELVLGATLV